METKNIFENIPADLREEVFEPIVDNPPVKIERILSRGQRSPESGWYDSEKDEWVIVLKGRAKLTFEHGP